MTAYSDPEDGPVRMGWLAPDFTYGNLDDLLDPVVTDAEGCAKIDLDLTETGDYCAVVYGNRAEHPGGLAVNVGLYGAAPGPRAGDHDRLARAHRAAAGRRRDALRICPLPDTLHGNAPATWMNMAVQQRRHRRCRHPALRHEHRRHARTWACATAWNPLAPRTIARLSEHRRARARPGTFAAAATPLSYELDYLDEVAESVERNNVRAPVLLVTTGSAPRLGRRACGTAIAHGRLGSVRQRRDAVRELRRSAVAARCCGCRGSPPRHGGHGVVQRRQY